MTTDEQHAHAIPASANLSDGKLRWLQRAFMIQSVLLVMVVAMMGYVSWRFSAQQRQWAAANLQKQIENANLNKQLLQSQEAYVTAEMNAAFEARNEKQNDRADIHIANALRFEPDDPILWRQKALIMIQEKRARQALDEMQKAPLSPNDGRNLLTQAILNCAAGELAIAKDLKAKALQSYRPTPSDNDDIQSVCHGQI